MRDPNKFTDQLAELIDNHDGFKLIADHEGVSSDEVALFMVEYFLKNIVFDDNLKCKLKDLSTKGDY